MSGTPISIVGNLGSDPELRFTPGGAPVATFSVAVAERKLDAQSGKWEDAGTTWWRVSCWRSLAEGVAESLTKGMRVIVVGTVRSREWTDQKTNEQRVTFEIQATSVGPDLTWSTAKVTRNAKGEQGPAPEDPRGTGAAVHRARPNGAANQANDPWQTGQAAPAPTSGGYPQDEPPF